MGDNNISNSEASDLSNEMKDFSVAPQTTDSPATEGESRWINRDYGKYLGYYKEIPEVETVIDVKSSWTCGGGYETDEATEMILNTITGNGKDTFTSILENMDRTREVGGDSYAQIMRDKDEVLINLKPLNPAVIQHVFDSKGMLIKFERIDFETRETLQTIELEDMFYLPRNRIADEMHGNTMIERLRNIILARNEAMEDQRTVFHRFVTPRWIIKLDTDDVSKIKAEKKKWDAANSKGENMYVPMGAVEVEQMAVAPNSTLNPQTQIENLNNYFYESAQVPRIIVGGTGGFTDGAVKIAYLAFEQIIKKRQLNIEEQAQLQLNIVFKLKLNASLEGDLLSDQAKDEENGAAQPSETSETPVEEATQRPEGEATT